MKELGITKGEWQVGEYKNQTSTIHSNEYSFAEVYYCESQEDGEFEANAKLIADAGTTANKCQMLPSELLQRYNEAIEVLEELVLIVKIHSKATKNNFAWAELEEAEQTISKAKGE